MKDLVLYRLPEKRGWKTLLGPLVRWMVYRKFSKSFLETHSQNIASGRLIRLELQRNEVREKLAGTLTSAFGKPVEVENQKVHLYPLACIEIPENHSDYLKMIGDKSRNMIKKAEKQGITYHQFDWNEHLDEIWDIHRSSSHRQGRTMDQAYLEYPAKVSYPQQEAFRIRHIGGFHDNKLLAYIELYQYGSFAMTNRILGHKDWLPSGIMNGLINHVVKGQCEAKEIRWLNYLTMMNREQEPLSGFKYRTGFREFSLHHFDAPS